MMSPYRWIFASLVISASLLSPAQADIPNMPGPNRQGPNVMGPNGQGPNGQGPNQKMVLKRQKEIDQNRHEIETLKEEILVIRKSTTEYDENDDDLDRFCECRPSKGACEDELFARLGVSPDSGSCEDLYDAVDGRLSKLPSGCRKKVRRCNRIARREEKKAQKAREKICVTRIRELQEENRKLEKEGEVVVVVDSAGTPCADCGYQRGPSNLAILGSSLINAGAQVGLGFMNLAAYKHGTNAYYNAYNNAMNGYYNFQTNAANQYYSNIPGMINHYTQLGIPYNYTQYMGGGGFPGPYPMMPGSMGMGGYFGAGLNPGLAMGMGGYPYGYGMPGAGMGLGLGLGLGMGPNPYAMGMGMGSYPYGLGMNAGYIPYMNGMGGMGMGMMPMMNPYGMGMGGGMGMNPYSLGMGGFLGGGYSGGMNPYGMGYGYGMGGMGGAQAYYLMEQQRMMQNQQNMYIAQQQLQEAQYRYMQVQSMGYPYYGATYPGYPGYGSYGLGVNLNFGLGGGFNIGNGYY